MVYTTVELTLPPLPSVTDLGLNKLLIELEELLHNLPVMGDRAFWNDEQEDILFSSVLMAGLLWCQENREKFEKGDIKIHVKYDSQITSEDLSEVNKNGSSFLYIYSIVLFSYAIPDILHENIEKVPPKVRSEIPQLQKLELYVTKDLDSEKIVFDIK